MRIIHYTTASIFSADYRCYGYWSQTGEEWHPTSHPADQLLSACSPSRFKPQNDLACVDPRLGDQLRCTVLIERSADRRQWCLAATVAGVKSTTRRDFTGRTIRDGIHISVCGDMEDRHALQEAIQAIRGIWRLAHDPGLTLDQWCSQEAFEQDLIPFPEPPVLWQLLVDAGLSPVADATAATLRSSGRRDQCHQEARHSSSDRSPGREEEGIHKALKWLRTKLTEVPLWIDELQKVAQSMWPRDEDRHRQDFENHSRDSRLNRPEDLEQSLLLLQQGRLRETTVLL